MEVCQILYVDWLEELSYNPVLSRKVGAQYLFCHKAQMQSCIRCKVKTSLSSLSSLILKEFQFGSVIHLSSSLILAYDEGKTTTKASNFPETMTLQQRATPPFG